MNNEALYLKLVGSVPAEQRFVDLSDAIDRGDMEAAFDAAQLQTLRTALCKVALYTHGREHG